MTLTDKIKETTLKDLKTINLDNLNLYAHENHQSLSALYNAEIINNTTIESALEQTVLDYARRDYQSLIQPKIPLRTQYPDHLIYPEFLVYAIEKGSFTKHELSKIKFDHGDTLETFTRSYRKENILETLRIQLLNPQQTLYLGDGTHCCC